MSEGASNSDQSQTQMSDTESQRQSARGLVWRWFREDTYVSREEFYKTVGCLSNEEQNEFDVLLCSAGLMTTEKDVSGGGDDNPGIPMSMRDELMFFETVKKKDSAGSESSDNYAVTDGEEDVPVTQSGMAKSSKMNFPLKQKSRTPSLLSRAPTLGSMEPVLETGSSEEEAVASTAEQDEDGKE